MENKTKKDVILFSQMVAKHKKWQLNSDKEFYDSIIDGLHTNYNIHGYFNCPCREAWGDREKDKDIVCPCNYAVQDIEEYGHCYCALYCSSDFILSKKEPESIPERRPENLQPK